MKSGIFSRDQMQDQMLPYSVIPLPGCSQENSLFSVPRIAFLSTAVYFMYGHRVAKPKSNL